MTKTRFFHPDQLTALRQSCDWRRLLADLGVRADVRRCIERLLGRGTASQLAAPILALAEDEDARVRSMAA